MKQRFLRFIPRSLIPVLKKIYYIPADATTFFTKKNSMIPPRSKIFIGSGDFIKIGEDFKKHFIELGNMQPNHKVLDVGCGIGRMAIPLTNYLTREGEYWGFDIVKEGIDWCQNHISPKLGNFHFLHSDIYNEKYNPKGKILAQDFKFPFADEYFDFVFLTSVFTHMLPRDVENYMSEISRVMKKGGKCLITFFILNEESTSLVCTGRSDLDFKYDLNGCLSTNKEVPEAAVAYEESVVKQLFSKNGLVINSPIYYGFWCKREKSFTYQDIIVAEKS